MDNPHGEPCPCGCGVERIDPPLLPGEHVIDCLGQCCIHKGGVVRQEFLAGRLTNG